MGPAEDSELFSGEQASFVALPTLSEWNVRLVKWLRDAYNVDVFCAARAIWQWRPSETEPESESLGRLGDQLSDEHTANSLQDIRLDDDDEHGVPMLGQDGRPLPNPDGTIWSGDAWEALRTRPVPNGTVGSNIGWPVKLLHEVPQPRVSEVLVFSSTHAMAASFLQKPSHAGWSLSHITHIFCHYRDGPAPTQHYTHQYAHAATMALQQAQAQDRLPALRVVQLYADYGELKLSIDSAGIWDLLHLRAIDALLLRGWAWRDWSLARVLHVRTSWPRGHRTTPSSGWTPTGLEQPSSESWQEMRNDASPEEQSATSRSGIVIGMAGWM
jgi:hypothetical protein